MASSMTYSDLRALLDGDHPPLLIDVRRRAAFRSARDQGISAMFLEGGLEEGWKGSGGALDAKPADANTRWVTRERPKIDRIACPWLIARFVDPGAEFLYAPAKEVLAAAKA